MVVIILLVLNSHQMATEVTVTVVSVILERVGKVVLEEGVYGAEEIVKKAGVTQSRPVKRSYPVCAKYVQLCPSFSTKAATLWW